MRKMSFDKFGDEFYARRNELTERCEDYSPLENRFAKACTNSCDPAYDEYMQFSRNASFPRGEYSKELGAYTKNVLPYSRVLENRQYTSSRHNISNASHSTGKPKKKRVNLFALFFSFGVFAVLCALSAACFSSLMAYTTYKKMTLKDCHTYAYQNNANLLREPEDNAQSKKYRAMVVYEAGSGRVLKSYNENQKVPMASTTKIATAIVVLENTKDLDKLHQIPLASVGVEGSSIYLRKEEQLSIRELLYGLMLASGNDAATALAILTSGSEEAFVEKMNELAQTLNLTNTHFVTTHGLHDDNHYTSALDLARLTAYAMQNADFREIVSTKRKTIDTDTTLEPRYLKNKQALMFNEDIEEDNIIINGVKSGFTPEAGRCLVTSAKANGMDVIIVVLNSPDMFGTTQELLTEAVDNFTMDNILPPYNHISKIAVSDSKTTSANICTKEGFSYPTTLLEHAQVRVVHSYPEKVTAPINADTIVGETKVYIDDAEVFSTPIYIIESAESNDIKYILEKIIKDAK